MLQSPLTVISHYNTNCTYKLERDSSTKLSTYFQRYLVSRNQKLIENCKQQIKLLSASVFGVHKLQVNQCIRIQ